MRSAAGAEMAGGIDSGAAGGPCSRLVDMIIVTPRKRVEVQLGSTGPVLARQAAFVP